MMMSLEVRTPTPARHPTWLERRTMYEPRSCTDIGGAVLNAPLLVQHNLPKASTLKWRASGVPCTHAPLSSINESARGEGSH